MRLSVTCERCQSKYQLDAGMRGKRMRCPNPICRAVIEVRDDNDPPPVQQPPTPAPVEATKPVDVVDDFPGDDEPAPIGKVEPPPKPVEQTASASAKLESSAAQLTAPPKAKPVEAKRPVLTPKPVEARKTGSTQRKPVPKPIEPERANDFPDDFPGDGDAAPAPTGASIATEAWQPETWDAPPVRDSVEPAPPATRGAGGPPAQTAGDEPQVAAPRRPRRWAPVVIVAMLAILAVGGIVLWRQIHRSIESDEAERFETAEKLYERREFADASAALQKMHRDFPDSPHNKKYRFLAELSDVRESVVAPHESPDELAKSLQRVLQFAGVYKDDPLLKEREPDVWDTLDELTRKLTQSAEGDKSAPPLALARRAWTESKRFAAPASISKAKRERELEDDWARIDKMLASHHERQRVIAAFTKNRDKTTAAGVQEAWTLAERTNRLGDSEIRGLLNDLFKAHREQVVFVPEASDGALSLPGDDALPSLSIAPSVKLARPVAATQPLVLALARGVLYALEPTKGELRWARRVGIDTHVLPLRVPADAITPEMLLVVSSDQRSLSAVLADTGETLWQTPLSDACLGTPVQVDRQVLVATVAGRIDEIEIAEGRRLGSYHVGQPLTLGGVRQPGTPFVYFPADEFCLYVFDITKRSCTNILYTRHPAGALPGLPTFLHPGKRDVLLLSQRHGPGRADIRAYGLPIEQPEQKPFGSHIALGGGLSAPPWQDANQLAILTDAGMLSLWGFHEKGTRDPLLFPVMKQDFPLEASKRPGRCQVIYGDADNLWAITHGKLQRVERSFDAKQGPGLVGRWTQPIVLGNLLHTAQATREPDGKTILFLTTQSEDHPTCLCSAIDADAGKILWQRQLGVIPQEAPHLVADSIVVPEALGVLRLVVSDDKKPWTQAGAWLLQEPWTGARQTVLTTDRAIVRLAWSPGDIKLRIQITPVAGNDKIRSLDVVLPASPQGTPALIGQHLLMPLQNGITVRVDLSTGALVSGPDDSRAPGAEEQSAGHIVSLNATDFLATDGSRGLQRIASDGKAWDKRASAQLAHRIIAPPVLVKEGKPSVCVADASDTLTLLDADRLTVLRCWSMPGKITAGPFVRAGKIGCIVAKSQLVWIDPNRKDPAWKYSVTDVVGEPNLIDGALVIADAAGQLRALDPDSGRPLGAVLTLKANVAATAAPLPFGPGRVFVPLTDGTAIVVPLEKLR